MFVINFRLSAADEFYSGDPSGCVSGDMVISAGKTYFMAGYDGAPLMDGETALDYVFKSLLMAAVHLEKSDTCAFALTFENDGYLCFERNGEQLNIFEMECCTPGADFIEGLPIGGEEFCREGTDYSQFTDEVRTKAKMFLSELSAADSRLLECADVIKINKMLGA